LPGGAYIMGKSDDDVANTRRSQKKNSNRSFYMDETEITNSEYRQFVDWVKDSTMRVNLILLMEWV
jgi:formylglycine-generating enzyme required for sulfatase activity